ncbi:MAG: hypothetical protein AB1394_03120 [Bacteroidota bacterium]
MKLRPVVTCFKALSLSCIRCIKKGNNSLRVNKNAYDEIISRIIAMKKSIDSDNQTSTEQNAEYFRNWWLKHVIEGDK